MPVQIDGINIHTDTKNMDKVSRLGCRWVRLDVEWWNIEGSMGRYSWSALDRQISLYRNAGFKIYATLMGTPRCYSSNIADPPNVNAWINFCTVFAKRYAGKVDVVSLWNEPNLGGKRFWTGSKLQFFEGILKPGYTAIKSVNPNIVVAAPDFATTSSSNWPSWFSKMEKYKEYIDILAVHTYHDTAEEVNRCWNFGKVPVLGWLVPKWRPYKWYISSIGKPVFLTEIGLEASFGNNKQMKKQKEFVEDIMKIKKDLHVQEIFFYCLLDADPVAEEPFGFYSRTGLPKTVSE